MYRDHQNLPRNDCIKVSGEAGYHLCTDPMCSSERNVQARRTAGAAPPRRARAVCSESSIVLPVMGERHVEFNARWVRGEGEGGDLELVYQFHSGSMHLEVTGVQLKFIMQAELHKVRDSDCLAHVFMGLSRAQDVRSRTLNPAGAGPSSRIKLACCDSCRYYEMWASGSSSPSNIFFPPSYAGAVCLLKVLRSDKHQ